MLHAGTKRSSYGGAKQCAPNGSPQPPPPALPPPSYRTSPHTTQTHTQPNPYPSYHPDRSLSPQAD